MIWKKNRTSGHRRTSVRYKNTRRGAAVLLLVAAVLAAIAFAAKTLVVAELRRNNHLVERERITTMESAIHFARELADRQLENTVQFEIESGGQRDLFQRIEVSLQNDAKTLQAQWKAGEAIVDTISRPR